MAALIKLNQSFESDSGKKIDGVFLLLYSSKRIKMKKIYIEERVHEKNKVTMNSF